MNHCYQCSSLTSDQSIRFEGFGLCGKCAIARKMHNGADYQFPRNPQTGRLCGDKSHIVQTHHLFFVQTLRDAARGKIRANHEAIYGWLPEFVNVQDAIEA